MVDLSGQAKWIKSTRSGGNSDNCVEVALNLRGVVAVRDSKNPEGPALVFAPGEWRSFTRTIREDSYDL